MQVLRLRVPAPRSWSSRDRFLMTSALLKLSPEEVKGS